MATRLPYAQGESGNVVIVGTCLDIARTSGRESRGQVGLPRLFCEWHQILAIHTILTHRLTQPTQRRLNLVGESGKCSNFFMGQLHPMALRRGYTVVSVRTCSKFCVTFVKSQSLRKRCISSTRLLEFPNPMQISSLRVYMLWNHVKTFKSSLFRVPWAIWTQVWRWCCLLGTPPQVSHQTFGMSRQFALLAAATSKTKRCCFLLLSERYFMLLRAQKTFEAYGRLVAALGLYLIFVFLRPIDSSSQWKIYKHLLIEKSREISLRIFKILNIQCCNVSLSESRPKKQFFKPRLFASCPRQGESKPALFQKFRCSKGYWKENQNIWRTKENKEWRKILKGTVSLQPAKQSTVMVYDMDPDEIGNQVSTENPNSQAGTWRARMMGVKSTSLAMLWTNCTRSIQLNENFKTTSAEKHPVYKRSKQTVAIRLGVMVPPESWQPWALLHESPAIPPGPQKLEHVKSGTDGTLLNSLNSSCLFCSFRSNPKRSENCRFESEVIRLAAHHRGWGWSRPSEHQISWTILQDIQ